MNDQKHVEPNHSINLREKQIGTELLEIRDQIYIKFKNRVVVTLREIICGRWKKGLLECSDSQYRRC